MRDGVYEVYEGHADNITMNHEIVMVGLERSPFVPAKAGTQEPRTGFPLARE
jgi:hypothetical protein